MMLETRCSDEGNPPLHATLNMYDAIEADYMKALENGGVAFAPRDVGRAEAAKLRDRLSSVGARIRNGGASVALGSLSRGCVACTGACDSRTFAVTNNCHRDCFFCFNPNQEKFAYYCEHPFPWRQQLDDLSREGSAPACLALSGGEPMLMPEEACAFFAHARKLFPGSHLRMYTSGDLLDRAWLQRLREAGMDEVRFSVKQDDPPHLRERVLANMSAALECVLTVMVEMPPIPGTESQMQDLLRRLDEIGIHGINLLEFTYPMWNWPVFESLGLTLKNPPYRVFYDYSYAGSLPVQGSEELCLRLMLWARDQGLGLNMHYCSLENKHRAQMRAVNEPHRHLDGRYAFDYDDFFMKAAMAFGPDRAAVRKVLKERGCEEFLEDERCDSTSFHPKWLDYASSARGRGGIPVRLCVSSSVVVERDGGFALRELKVERVSDGARVQLTDKTRLSDDAAGDSVPSCK